MPSFNIIELILNYLSIFLTTKSSRIIFFQITCFLLLINISSNLKSYLRFSYNDSTWIKLIEDINYLTSNGSWHFSNKTISVSLATNQNYHEFLKDTNKTYADKLFKNYETLAPCRSEDNFRFWCIHALDNEIEQIHYIWRPSDMYRNSDDNNSEYEYVIKENMSFSTAVKSKKLNYFSTGGLN